MKIIFSGGGTLGSVMPLIAVYQELKSRHPDWRFLWVGTKNGPEKNIAAECGLEFTAIASAKWRRYFSWRNFLEIFNFLTALVQSRRLIKEYNPDLLISAGGFVSVPLHLAAWLSKKTTIAHQQDVKIGLADKIISRFSVFITVALEKNLNRFPKNKALLIGNPIRPSLLEGRRERAIGHFSLDPNIPTVLILGGGSGALSLNKLAVYSLVEWIDLCQVIHMTGRGKEIVLPLFRAHANDKLAKERYHPVEFLSENLLKNVLAAADLVVTRAGMSTLSELSVLGKPVLIMPLADSPQEENARYFNDRSGASVFYAREKAADFVKIIRRLLSDDHERMMMGRDIKKIIPSGARQKFCLLVEEIEKQKSS